MDLDNIKNYLSILKINSIDQLEENDLDYWHQKRFIEIQRSSRKKELITQELIALNNAKDYLEEFDLEILKKQFEKNQENIFSQSEEFDEEFDEDFVEEFDEEFVYKRNDKNSDKKNKTFFLKLLNFFMIKDQKNIWKLILFVAGFINVILALIIAPIMYWFAFVFLFLIIGIIAKNKDDPYF